MTGRFSDKPPARGASDGRARPTSKSGDAKSAAPRSGAGKPSTGKPSTGKPAMGKPSTSKFSAGKASGAKPSGGKTGGNKFGSGRAPNDFAVTGIDTLGRSSRFQSDKPGPKSGARGPQGKTAAAPSKFARRQDETYGEKPASRNYTTRSYAERSGTAPVNDRPRNHAKPWEKGRPSVPAILKGPARLILVNKPYDVLCQFTDKNSPSPRLTLSDILNVPEVYPAGRLDRDSEGLLILTNDGRQQSRITDPKYKVAKTYLAQVEGTPDAAAIQALCDGVMLNDGMTLPAEARIIPEPDWLWPREPPIRVRQSIPDTWIELTIREGRNRQVRRMTAAIGHPTLRLIRWRVGDWTLADIPLGGWRDA